MIYRPQKRDQKKRSEMLQALKPGTRVMTIGGIYGEITKIKDERIRIKVAENVEIWIRRSAVGNVIATEFEKANAKKEAVKEEAVEEATKAEEVKEADAKAEEAPAAEAESKETEADK